MLDGGVLGPRIEAHRGHVLVTTTTVIYSLGHGLCTLTAVPRLTQPSTFCGTVKWVLVHARVVGRITSASYRLHCVIPYDKWSLECIRGSWWRCTIQIDIYFTLLYFNSEVFKMCAIKCNACLIFISKKTGLLTFTRWQFHVLKLMTTALTDKQMYCIQNVVAVHWKLCKMFRSCKDMHNQMQLPSSFGPPHIK